MRWVIKVTEAAGQYRITLPKTFCSKHEIEGVDYLVIDDTNPEQITIGRLVYGGKEKGSDQNG